MSWTDDDVAGPAPTTAWTDDDVAGPATNTLGQEAKRQGGLFLRHALSAAGSVGALPADAIGKAVNYVAGREVVPNQQRALQQTLTNAGLPEPGRPIERFTRGVAEAAPAFALPATLPAQVLGNAAIAGAQAPQGQELREAAVGGAFGAGGQALGRVVGGVVKPTAEAQELASRGVALTPGQAAGPNTWWSRAENSLASNPIAGSPIRNAQRRAVEEANKAAAEAVAGIVEKNVKLGLPPREAIEQTRDLISGAYHQSLEGMSWPAQALKTDLQASMQHLPKDLPLTPPDTLKRIDGYLNNRLGPLLSGTGNLTGDQLKQIDAELGQMARNLANSQNTTERVQAPAWREVQSYVRDAMENAAATPEQHALLSKANTAYRQLLALEKAMLPGNNTFTPRRLKATLERMGIKNTELNTVAGAMEKTLPNTVNDSGTAERLLTNALPSLLLGGGGVAQGLGWDTVGAGLMAAGALGSRPGARALTGNLPLQQAIANALRRSSPAVANAATREEQ